jgi:uncharacterized protein (DUF983 family)
MDADQSAKKSRGDIRPTLAPLTPDAGRCPRCGGQAAMIYVHGHAQCSACGSNILDCCQGADCDLAPDA